MSIFRLRSVSPRPLKNAQGTCAACGKRVSGPDVAVRIYGDLFHHGCAYYRARGPRRRGG